MIQILNSDCASTKERPKKSKFSKDEMKIAIVEIKRRYGEEKF